MSLHDFKDISMGQIAAKCIRTGKLPKGKINSSNIYELFNDEQKMIYNNLIDNDKRLAVEYYKTAGCHVATLLNCNTDEIGCNNGRVIFNLEEIKKNDKIWKMIMEG